MRIAAPMENMRKTRTKFSQLPMRAGLISLPIGAAPQHARESHEQNAHQDNHKVNRDDVGGGKRDDGSVHILNHLYPSMIVSLERFNDTVTIRRGKQSKALIPTNIIPVTMIWGQAFT